MYRVLRLGMLSPCAVATLLLTISGCGSSSTTSVYAPSYKDETDSDLPRLIRQHTVLHISPDDGERLMRDQVRRCIKLGDRLVKEIVGVDDDASAKRAIERIDKHLAEFDSYPLHREITIVSAETRGVIIAAMPSHLIEEVRQAEQRWKESLTDFVRSGNANVRLSWNLDRDLTQRASRIRNLPFIIKCNLHVGGSLDTNRTTIFFDAGPNGPLIDELLAEKHDTSFKTKRIDGRYVKSVVSNMELSRVQEVLDIGTVTATNEETSSLLVVLSDEEKDKLNQLAKVRADEALAEQEAERKRKEAIELEKLEQKKMEEEEDVVVAIESRDTTLRAVVQTLQAMATVESTVAGLDALVDRRSNFHRAESSLRRALSHYEAVIREEYQFDDAKPAMVAEVAAELKRIQQDKFVRVTFTRKLGPSAMSATSFLDTSDRYRPEKKIAEDPEHPDYIIANYLDLVHGRDWDKRSALKQLATIDPSSTTDRDLQKEIARALWNHYQTASRYEKQQAIIPLGKWGGKYSVPLLLGMLDGDDSTAAKLVFLALADYPSPEVAARVTEFVGDRRSHEDACKCLVKLGKFAEEPLLAMPKSEEGKVEFARVYILGEVGTNKSIRLLRKSTSSPNRDVKQAAKDAIQKILAREGE